VRKPGNKGLVQTRVYRLVYKCEASSIHWILHLLSQHSVLFLSGWRFVHNFQLAFKIAPAVHFLVATFAWRVVSPVTPTAYELICVSLPLHSFRLLLPICNLTSKVKAHLNHQTLLRGIRKKTKPRSLVRKPSRNASLVPSALFSWPKQRLRSWLAPSQFGGPISPNW